jgi:hypothetical protein
LRCCWSSRWQAAGAISGWFIGNERLARLLLPVIRRVLAVCLMLAALLTGLNARWPPCDRLRRLLSIE